MAPLTKLSRDHLVLEFDWGGQHSCLDLKFARAVDTERCSMRVEDDHIAVRLPVVVNSETGMSALVESGEAFDDDGPPIPSTAELESENLHMISCRFCEEDLLREGTIENAMPLPSGHWAELAEFWVCHECNLGENPLWASSLELRPRPRRGLIGACHVLLHGDAVQNVRIDRAIGAGGGGRVAAVQGGSSDVLYARCVRCETVVGVAHVATSAAAKEQDEHAGGTSPETETYYSLHKHQLRATSATASGIDAFGTYSVATVIAAAMQHAAEARGCFHFRVCVGSEEDVAAALENNYQLPSHLAERAAVAERRRTGRVRAGLGSHLDIQLMSWEGSVRTRGTATRPACRVLYCLPERSATLPSNSKVSEWLVLTDEGCAELQNALQASTALMPASAREVHGKALGFLWWH